jgi:Nucleotidyltransferase of unknown function (DUF6036)
MTGSNVNGGLASLWTCAASPRKRTLAIGIRRTLDRFDLEIELENRGVKKQVRILLIGGTSMLLFAKAPRSTRDIDIFWLDEDGLWRVSVPLRESVQAITRKHDLAADWLNYLAQLPTYDEVIVPEGKLWERLGSLYNREIPAAGQMRKVRREH